MSDSVLVTGAASGIGRATALRLAGAGYRVFAGVRKLSDGEALQKDTKGRLDPVIIEVTDAGSIAAAVKEVEGQLGGEGLAALVNNAGIGTSSPLEFMPMAELENIFRINVFGLIAVTQAFLPLLRKGRGRIVNVGSIGDRFTVPFGGALCASKAAVRTLNEALRMELHAHGIHVSLVQPTSVATPAVTKFEEEAQQKLASLPPDAERLYGDAYRAFIQTASKNEQAGSPPEVIAEAIYHAVTDARPRTRHVAGKMATLMTLLPAVLPDRVLDAAKFLLFGMPIAFGAYAVGKQVRKRARLEEARRPS